jgi:hypothetical protein
MELRILFDDDDRPSVFVSTTQRLIQLQYELVEKISCVCQEHSEELERVTQCTRELQLQLVEVLARLVQRLNLTDL